MTAEEGVRLHAWVDESMRSTGVDVPMYLLGASLATIEQASRASELLLEHAPRGKKLHWRDLGDSGKTNIQQVIPRLELNHVIVVGTPLVGIKQERARGLCLERLLWELDQQRVSRTFFESRGKALDLSDRRRIDGLRARNALSRETRVDWIRGETDPMLWSPDILLGTVGDAHVHHTALPEQVTRQITEVTIELS